MAVCTQCHACLIGGGGGGSFWLTSICRQRGVNYLPSAMCGIIARADISDKVPASKFGILARTFHQIQTYFICRERAEGGDCSAWPELQTLCTIVPRWSVLDLGVDIDSRGRQIQYNASDCHLASLAQLMFPIADPVSSKYFKGVKIKKSVRI